jgi:hypothetical protein
MLRPSSFSGFSALGSLAGVWCSPSGAVGSPGRSFSAYHEVDAFADIFLGADYLDAVTEEGDPFLYESQYIVFLEL